MSAQVQPFDFEGAEVRIVSVDGAPWWVLGDVCQVLGIDNSRDAAARLDDDERNGVDIADAIGRSQTTTVINESGLFSLILTSRKPAARRFRKWVTSEVLPAIHATGTYTAPSAARRVSSVRNGALGGRPRKGETQTAAALRRQGTPANLPADPRGRLSVYYLKLSRTGAHSVTLEEAAEHLRTTRTELLDDLQERGWIYATRAYPFFIAAEEAIRLGHLMHSVTTHQRHRRRDELVVQLRVTALGLGTLLAEQG